MRYSYEYNADKTNEVSAEGGNRTLIPVGNTILSRARLPIPPLRLNLTKIPPRRGAPKYTTLNP